MHTISICDDPCSDRPTSRLGMALAAVEEAIDAATSSVDFTVSPTELGDAVCAAVAVRNKFDALMAALVASAERARVAADAGLRTTAQYVAAQTNADPSPVRRAATLGRWLRDFDRFSEAFAAGEMSESHLRLIRTKLHCGRTHFALVQAQELFVDAARDCSFADFEKVAQYWLIAVDPDGEEPEDQWDKTRLSLRTGRGGRLIIDGEVDAVAGQAIRNAIETEAEKLLGSDAETGLERSDTQRRAAALERLVTRGAARADGSHSTPMVNIVMSERVAEWLLTQLAEPTDDAVPVHWSDVDGRCELIDGTPIHPRLALATLGVATLRRCIMDALGRNLDISVNARRFPQWMRIGLHVESRGRCDTLGCDAPHSWIQADHVDPVRNGGPTAYTNAQNQCRPDNYAKAATTGHTPWRDRRRPRRRPGPRNRPADPGDPGDVDDDLA